MRLPDIFELLVFLVVPIVLVTKWRGLGALISIPVGWAAVYGVLKCFPYDQVWEELEDWPRFGLFFTSIWSLFVYGIVSLWFWIRKRRQTHA
jgi:hypothetical protein